MDQALTIGHERVGTLSSKCSLTSGKLGPCLSRCYGAGAEVLAKPRGGTFPVGLGQGCRHGSSKINLLSVRLVRKSRS